MTTAQHNTIARINADLATDRELAELNSRPALDLKAKALNLYHAMMVAKADGDITKARALATELKPLLSYLD